MRIMPINLQTLIVRYKAGIVDKIDKSLIIKL